MKKNSTSATPRVGQKYACKKRTSKELAGWKVSKVTPFGRLLLRCVACFELAGHGAALTLDVAQTAANTTEVKNLLKTTILVLRR